MAAPAGRATPRADGAVPGSIAVHEPTIQPECLAGRCHPDMHRKIIHRAHHSFPLVSSAVGSPKATHSFFLGLDDQFRPLELAAQTHDIAIELLDLPR